MVGGLVGGLGVGSVGGLGVELVGRLVSILGVWLVGGLVGGLSVGLVIGLQYGGAAVVKHVVLRRLLTQAGVAPLNYAEFLDYCASCYLMRRVGGGYIFRHRMLMEYFAESER